MTSQSKIVFYCHIYIIIIIIITIIENKMFIVTESYIPFVHNTYYYDIKNAKIPLQESHIIEIKIGDVQQKIIRII